MNELIRQVIKEGHKNIMIMSCNPGHHKLADDLEKRKDVHINYAKNTLLAESASVYEESDEIMYNLCKAEENLMNICLENGIDYNDNEVLLEAFNEVSDMNLEAIDEGSAPRMQDRLPVCYKNQTFFGDATESFLQSIRRCRWWGCDRSVAFPVLSGFDEDVATHLLKYEGISDFVP